MTVPLTITASVMRDINRSAILEIVRRESPISRTAIAERLDVSLPTVMRIVDELIAEGLARPQGDSEWSGGRRRPLLEFNADGQVVLAVDLGSPKIYGALSNLGGTVIDELTIDRRDAQGDEAYAALVTLIDALLPSPRLEGRPVRGIGVGAPGITRHTEGIVQRAYLLNWKDFPLKARLVERYRLPVTVDNEVNLAALGELWFGAGQNCQNMIVIAIRAGIRAGIIIDGALYRGSHEASGEIGAMLPGKEFLGKNYLDFGALESVASGAGIAERAREALKSRHDRQGRQDPLPEDIFDAARQGQKWARDLIDETVDYLAVSIANLTVSFDPDLIVLGGSIAPSADLLVGPILQRMEGTIPTLPRLVISSLGLRAGVMGAIPSVLLNTSNFYVVQKLS